MAKPKNPQTPLAKRLVQVIDMFKEEYDLPDALGVDARSISNYQRGSSQPKAEFFQRLSGLTGVNLNWLLKGEGLMFSAPEQDVPYSASSMVNMKDQYVKVILQRLVAVQIKKQFLADPDFVWWIVSALHQNMMDEFGGREVSDEEAEPLLRSYIDEQAEKAGW